METEWLTSLPDRFMPGKEPRYPLSRKLGGEKKNVLPLLEFEPWTVQPLRLVARPTTLSGLFMCCVGKRWLLAKFGFLINDRAKRPYNWVHIYHQHNSSLVFSNLFLMFLYWWMFLVWSVFTVFTIDIPLCLWYYNCTLHYRIIIITGCLS
jgi:hypothetical protein